MGGISPPIEIGVSVDVGVCSGNVDEGDEVRISTEDLRETAVTVESCGKRPDRSIEDDRVPDLAVVARDDDLAIRIENDLQLFRG